MAEIFATLISPSANVVQARAEGCCAFSRGLSASGQSPATHYVSSGTIPEECAVALSAICSVTTGDHDPYQAIADAGLQLVQYPPFH